MWPQTRDVVVCVCACESSSWSFLFPSPVPTHFALLFYLYPAKDIRIRALQVQYSERDIRQSIEGPVRGLVSPQTSSSVARLHTTQRTAQRTAHTRNADTEREAAIMSPLAAVTHASTILTSSAALRAGRRGAGGVGVGVGGGGGDGIRGGSGNNVRRGRGRGVTTVTRAGGKGDAGKLAPDGGAASSIIIIIIIIII